jgi:tRNA A-37 threonylcarbamoyl transferase component Bud32
VPERAAFLRSQTSDYEVHTEVDKLLVEYDQSATLVSSPSSAAIPSQPAGRPGRFHGGEILSGRFKILRFVAEGGMGEYEAEDLELHEHMAIKTLRPEVLQQADGLERFKREVHLARKVTHKNVCRVHEINRFDHVAAISMEYVEGDTVRQVLRRYGPLSIRRTLDWVHQICAGMQAAHEAGITHRDLKPANLVITRENVVKIMDFGIAHSIETKATQTGIFLGTPDYAAPEQIRGEKTNARTDIYALGVIMYEMLTGRVPFQGDSATAVLMSHLHESPVPPRSIEPSIPVFLEELVLRCLEKKAENRYASIRELEAELIEKPVAEPKATPGTHPVLEPELLRWRSWDWALVAAGLIGVFLFVRYSVYVVPAAGARVHATSAVAEGEAQRLAKMAGWGEMNVLAFETPDSDNVNGLPGSIETQIVPLIRASGESSIGLPELIAQSIPLGSYSL